MAKIICEGVAPDKKQMRTIRNKLRFYEAKINVFDDHIRAEVISEDPKVLCEVRKLFQRLDHHYIRMIH